MGAPRFAKSAGLTARESVYLDLVRALAAFVVVLDHAPTLFALPDLPRWGHQAVIVFFVLSGYVICHTADERERNGRRFLIARFARLWSVLVPAMALTILCEIVAHLFGDSAIARHAGPIDHPLIRIGAVLVFLSESWVSIQPLSNGVVWSLCVEFWYYMIFAAWVFLPRGRLRLCAIAVAALLAGHKGLLLLPIWLMGVGLQRARLLRRLPVAVDLLLCTGGLAILAWVLATMPYDPAIGWMRQNVDPWVVRQLAQARVFWLDWLLGLAVAAHLLGARTLLSRVPIERVAAPVRWCAGVSFAAYLFHMPLLGLCAAFLPEDQGIPALVLTFTAIALLGPPAERSKTWWRRQLERLGDRLPLAPLRAVRLTR